MNITQHSSEEYQVDKLAAALEYQLGATQLIGDQRRVIQVVEHILEKSSHASPSRTLWEQAVREYCVIDENKKQRWPDHGELNVLLFQLLRVAS